MFVSIVAALSPMLAVFFLNIFLYITFGLTEEIWFSMPMHALGGFVTAWSAVNIFGLIKKKYRLVIQPYALFAFFLIGTTAIVGILWEVYEFISDALTPLDVQLTLADTILDLLMDMLGAGIFALSFGKIWFHRERT